MKKKQIETLLYSVVGVAAMFFVIVAVNFIFGAFKTRADLTQEKLYTLSDGTKAILKKLDGPVEIRFYCTQGEKEMPTHFKAYAQRVEDLLSEYRQHANGNIEIKRFNPQPDSDAEDSAQLDGVEGQLLPNGEHLYLGIAVSYLDGKAALPFLSPEREKLLEYDISRAITRVMTPEKPVVGVMTPLPMFGQPMNPMMMRMGQQPQEPWVVIGELQRDFTVKQIQMDVDKIDDEVKVLVVVHPKNIGDKAQYAIDQFVMRGGKLIAFLDAVAIMDQSGQQNPMMPNMSGGSSMEKLLKAWGINFDTTKVVADLNFTTRFMRNNRPEAAPAVLSLNPEGINKDDVVTSQIDNLLVPFAGVFTGTPAEGLKQTVLLKTTGDSQLVEGFMAQMGADAITKDFKPSGTTNAIAIRLAGKFKTAFPDGKPAEKKDDDDDKKDEKKEETKPEESLKESKGDNVVVLVGDADMLYDQFCVQIQNIFGQKIVIPRNGNLNLAQNVVEQMTGDSNLIGVRSRATLNRPFTVVQQMQAKAEESYRTKIKELEAGLQETQSKLNELQAKKEKGQQRFILSPEQQAELEKFRKKEAEAKRELKEVRKNLRKDIDALENTLKWANIAGMPFLVAAFGVVLAMYKNKRARAK
ncbi:MAG: Gldg family protein [Verrucomicrobia subdivision 3 bacterium]|nr:Gldg family protein [Limisphaerales bacterium]